MHLIIVSLGYFPDRIGGAFRYVQELAEFLASHGHRIEVVFPANEEQTVAAEQRNGVHLHRITNPPGSSYINWRKENQAAFEVCRSLAQPDTVFILAHAFYWRALAALQRPYHSLFTGPWALEHRFHHRDQAKSISSKVKLNLTSLLMHRMESNALRNANKIFTISQYYKLTLPRWHSVKLPEILNISGGVNAGKFRLLQDKEIVRTRYPAVEGAFLTVRRLEERMGLRDLLTAFSQAAASFTSAKLCLVGEGSQKQVLARMIQDLGLSQKTHLLGAVPEDDLTGLYNLAKCSIVPSLGLEGLGLSTLESLACGAPVLGSLAGATPEILEPFSPELLYPAGDRSILAQKIQSIVNGALVLPSPAACREYITSHFRWETTATALIKGLARE